MNKEWKSSEEKWKELVKDELQHFRYLIQSERISDKKVKNYELVGISIPPVSKSFRAAIKIEKIGRMKRPEEMEQFNNLEGPSEGINLGSLMIKKNQLNWLEYILEIKV